MDANGQQAILYTGHAKTRYTMHHIFDPGTEDRVKISDYLCQYVRKYDSHEIYSNIKAFRSQLKVELTHCNVIK